MDTVLNITYFSHKMCYTALSMQNHIPVQEQSACWCSDYEYWSLWFCVTVITWNDGHDNTRWSWINSLQYHYSATLFQSTLMHVSILAQFLYTLPRKIQLFALPTACIQYFTTSPCSVYHETPLKVSKQLSAPLTKAAADISAFQLTCS
jgi:hypothetical protein